MIYTLSLCLGMFLGTCGAFRTFDYPTAAECEAARKNVSVKSIGDGYAICAPKKEKP